MIEFVGVIFTPVVYLLDFLFNTVGTVIGGIIVIGVPLGIIYAIYRNIKDVTRSKSAFKEFITVQLPLTILMILLGVGIAYLVTT
jgi:hypothetical protein